MADIMTSKFERPTEPRVSSRTTTRVAESVEGNLFAIAWRRNLSGFVTHGAMLGSRNP